MHQAEIDQKKLEIIKDRAVYAAGAFANSDWLTEAESAIKMLCRLGDDFTGDDVWRLLAGTSVTTPEPRALGAVITKFAREGYIFPTGYYRKSIRKESHRRPLAVWRPTKYKRNRKEAE